jgi:hypothetical protein
MTTRPLRSLKLYITWITPAGVNDFDQNDKLPQGLNSTRSGDLDRARTRRRARPAPSPHAKIGKAAVAGGFAQISADLGVI